MQVKINEKIRERVGELAEKYHLKLVLIFGSQSKGDTHKESDVDIAILPEKILEVNEEINLNYEFTNIFQNDRVDTVNIRKAPPLLLKQIFDSPLVLYQKSSEEFSNYQIYAIRRYAEAKPLFKLRHQRLQSIL